ncbi:MAG: hypothetical protein IK016_01405 [Lachnospiraceae bacterium]|nr:hypothetical protein [Lachnospiraceae bacterium]
MDENNTMGELDELFGDDELEMQQNERIVLTQNLQGFASCFPNWDLHPPVK